MDKMTNTGSLNLFIELDLSFSFILFQSERSLSYATPNNQTSQTFSLYMFLIPFTPLPFLRSKHRLKHKIETLTAFNSLHILACRI